MVPVLLLLLFPLVSLAVDPIVKTSFGSIRGSQRTANNGNVVNIFKSVPFAAPPVGDLRWKMPQNPIKWEGIIDGREYSAACLSNHTASKSKAKIMNEDCLYLNVFVGVNCKGDCPITVMLHGGGMNFDSAVYYNDDYLIENFASKGIMLVVPAFRLGFLAIFDLGNGDESIPSNIGALDAIQALSFLSKEAVNFGGDSESLTLFGHSYGAALAGAVAYSPLRKEKVKISQLVMMSPSFQFNRSPALIKWLTYRLVEKAGCTEGSISNQLECLKSRDAVELLQYQSEMEIEDETAPWSNIETDFQYILMESPLLPFPSFAQMFNNPPGVDVVIGSTIREMDYPIELKVQFPRSHPGDLIDAQNLIELEKIHETIVEIETTEIIFMTVNQVARSVINGGNTAFVYSYRQPSEHNYHTDDFSFLAGIHLFDPDENEKEIAKFYPELFANFTLHGIPSPDWTPMHNNDSAYFSIAVDIKTGRRPMMMDGYEADTVNYWTNKAPRIDLAISESKTEKHALNAKSFEELIKIRSIPTVEVLGQSNSSSHLLPLMVIGAVGALFLVAMMVKPRRINEESIGIINASNVSRCP